MLVAIEQNGIQIIVQKFIESMIQINVIVFIQTPISLKLNSNSIFKQLLDLMKARPYSKFVFSDYRLSDNVRAAMTSALLQYDSDNNKIFDEGEIINALVGILKEDHNEVAYFVKNVFRYDTDNDKQITPEQFINFCLQQHFGEMAIQRLHRQKYYSRGSERIMNLQEFQNTLNYCLGKINSTGTHSEYQRLFKQVDIDNDGYITYQEYFMFLRQYFGSERAVPYSPIKPKPMEPVEPPKKEQYLDMCQLTAQQRFAKLVYSQLKLKVMDRDQNRNLILEKRQIDDILSNVFNLNFTEQSQIESNILGNPDKMEYEEFMKKVVVHYVCEIDPKKNIFESEIAESDFIESATRATRFVDVKPAQHILKTCFKSADSARSGSISKNTYINTMRNIFQMYTFDKRGLPRNISYQQRYY